ncbi:cytochrome C biogenesis protein ResB [Geomonas sp. RF6]|uniref:cytochrome C biogenesis protein ResB n=1 Tax=Geomonas sp. RF6 TaxID=2897342 RepID=UPI001E2EF06D|nr:cytochrome C biogenesis protein ResB [Geomonas sp. RF6]UFS72279.1 cytochrome C biogenesis protein ResB [Geomonas sp. RF6]
MLKTCYEKLSSLTLGLWLMALVMLFLAIGSFSPGSSEQGGLNDVPLFVWLKEIPLPFSWWLWLALLLLVVLTVNTILCTVEALKRKGRGLGPHLMHAGFLLVAFAHLCSAYGSFKEPVQLRQGGSLAFPDGASYRIERIHATQGAMGMMSDYGIELRAPDGRLLDSRPNHPVFHRGYGIYVKQVALEPEPAALVEVHREPGAIPALAGALIFTVGNIMLLAARRGR